MVIPCDGIERRPILRHSIMHPRILHLFTGADVDPFVEIDRQPNRRHRLVFDTRRNDTTSSMVQHGIPGDLSVCVGVHIKSF